MQFHYAFIALNKQIDYLNSIVNHFPFANGEHFLQEHILTRL